MTMGKNKELLEQQNKWEELIHQTEQEQKKMLDIMIQLRKDIASLSQLIKNFPESVKIEERMKKCDHLLKQSLETFDDIKKKLSEFKKEKASLDQLIKKDSESSSSCPHRFT